jgi:hypothetical protein
MSAIAACVLTNAQTIAFTRQGKLTDPGAAARVSAATAEQLIKDLKMPKLPAGHAFCIEWLTSDASAQFPAPAPGEKNCRCRFTFKIVSEEIYNVVLSKRWNAVYRATVFSLEKERS